MFFFFFHRSQDRPGLFLQHVFELARPSVFPALLKSLFVKLRAVRIDSLSNHILICGREPDTPPSSFRSCTGVFLFFFYSRYSFKFEWFIVINYIKLPPPFFFRYFLSRRSETVRVMIQTIYHLCIIAAGCFVYLDRIYRSQNIYFQFSMTETQSENLLLKR